MSDVNLNICVAIGAPLQTKKKLTVYPIYTKSLHNYTLNTSCISGLFDIGAVKDNWETWAFVDLSQCKLWTKLGSKK